MFQPSVQRVPSAMRSGVDGTPLGCVPCPHNPPCPCIHFPASRGRLKPPKERLGSLRAPEKKGFLESMGDAISQGIRRLSRGGGSPASSSLGMLIDGQHRLGAAHLLSQRGKLSGALSAILVEVYPPMEEANIKELFTEINKAEPVLLVDLPEGGASESDNAVLTIAAEELRESKRREKLEAKEARRRKRSAVPEWAKVAPPSEPASAEPLSVRQR